MVQLKGAGPIHQGTSVPTRIVITNILKEISHDAVERPRAHLSWACQKQKLCAELPSVKKPRTFQKTSPPTTGKKNGQRVWEGQSQRHQVLCPSGSPHTGVQSESPAGAGSPVLGSQSRCLQQSLARHLAPAYPLIWRGGRGATSARPGARTLWCLFGPRCWQCHLDPLQLTGLGTQPLPHPPACGLQD